MSDSPQVDVLSGIEWTDDCSGKKDFDGDIVRLSTRYWPRGGSFLVRTAGGAWEGGEARPEIKPSAKSELLLLGVVLDSEEFEAETEEQVKALVEGWARTQIGRVRHELIAAFERARP